MRAESSDFDTIAKQVIWIEKIGTVLIPLAEKDNIELHNLALASGCDFNLIFFRQLRKSEMTYYNNDINKKRKNHCLNKIKPKSIHF